MEKLHLIIVFITFIACLGCNKTPNWYRGNTHAHTVICGHADSTPETVAKWYHDHGYHFLILSEHNHFINPRTVKLPENSRSDFILIPGEEVSGPEIIHTTAMNINRLVSQRKDLEIKSEILQNHIDSISVAGGHTILNHPNYYYKMTTTDILPVNGLNMFELYNGHPDVKNFGDAEHHSTEELWDLLLAQGMTIYGVSSDDAHHFVSIGSEYSNPGRGWVMVDAPELSPNAISAAMRAGNFYASSGVFLRQCSATQSLYRIEIDVERTRAELDSGKLHGKLVDKGEVGFFIEFIGPNGRKKSYRNFDEISYSFDATDKYYIRPKVTYRRQHPEYGLEEFYAWGQPAFRDHRK